jgi:hypothetical protein
MKASFISTLSASLGWSRSSTPKVTPSATAPSEQASMPSLQPALRTAIGTTATRSTICSFSTLPTLCASRSLA